MAALGVLAVLGLIVAALGDSMDAQRRVERAWNENADHRLAMRWALRALREASTAAKVSSEISGTWGNTPVRATARSLPVDSPAYGHMALDPRPGDTLATVTIGDETATLLVRLGPPATWHRLPAQLVPVSPESTQEPAP
jgi:hypothetical protein